MNRVAIIPARGGSKRIPRKNVKNFCGKPMLAWSIEAAIESECFDKIIVSTDDPEIAEIGQKFGADIPFIRPENLADDFTGTIPVIRHAIEWLNSHDRVVDYACCIYATAPFVSAHDICNGWHLITQPDIDYAFTVTSFPFPIQRAIRVSNKNRISMFNPELFDVRSQDLEEAWHDAGQFYWGKASAWLREKPIFSSCSAPILLPRHQVQDIDTKEDWIRAEWLFKAIRASMEGQ